MEVTVEVYCFKCIYFPVYTTTVYTELETGTASEDIEEEEQNIQIGINEHGRNQSPHKYVLRSVNFI